MCLDLKKKKPYYALEWIENNDIYGHPSLLRLMWKEQVNLMENKLQATPKNRWLSQIKIHNTFKKYD